jgi:tRNA-2-methylthio-N6-dimethylallyladenosine synthase
MNEHDSERIASDLSASGMERVDDPEEADVVVLNTCCIRENADNRLYGTLGHLKSLQERRPELKIAVAGCLAQKDRDVILERAPYVNVVFGTHNVSRSVALLDQARETDGSVIEILEAPLEPEDAFAPAAAVHAEHPYSAWVTIQVGCDNSCAYCIVPQVRGPERSRPFADLVKEVEDMAKRGTFEITLLGQNVNSYGRDLTLALRNDPSLDAEYLTGASFAASKRSVRPLFGDLLRAAGAVEGIRRIRFISPHPKDLRDETIAAMADTEAVCEQLHLPLQSGSNSVLRRMRRGYTAERYLDRLEVARQSIPDLAVTTDLIVGFPGETEQEFEATLKVVAEARYDSTFTFIYSPRPGTEAAKLVDDEVPAEVIAERYARLKEVVDRASRECHNDRIGRKEEIVVEGVAKRDEALQQGRTRQGKVVLFAPGEVPLEPGTVTQTTIVGAGTYHLRGELLGAAVPARPPRRLIPLAAD